MTTAFEVADAAKGWLHPDEGPALHEFASRAPDGYPLLEVGTYCGKSACWIGQAAKDNATVLFAVDHHRGSPEMMAPHSCYDAEVVVDGRHDTLPTLRETIAAAGLEGVVIPVVGPSETVGKWWTIDLGFVFIDGGHDRVSAINDYTNFGARVVTGGYLLFHDSDGTEAEEAVELARADGGWRELALIGCTAVFQRR